MMTNVKSVQTTLALLVVAATVVSSCQATSKKVANSAKYGGTSKVSSVSVKLPDAAQFKPSQGSAQVNAVALTVKPQDNNCADATRINATMLYTKASLDDQKFHRGCAYIVTLALGERSGVGPMTAYYASGDTIVSSKDLEADPVNVNINLNLTQAGQAAGMPATLSNVQPNPNPNPNPNTVPPSNGLPALDQKIASVSLVQNGQNVPLSQVFTTQYMVVDYSQPGCGPCMSHAEQMNQPAYAQKFSGSGKCSSIVLIEKSQLSDWASLYPNSFVSKHSYSYSAGSMNSFSSLVGGSSITGTPTFMIIDRTGKIVGQEVGQEPQEVASLCQ